MILSSEQETIAFATRFAESLNAGDVVLLRGDLGAGKSVFARAIIRTLSNDETLEVPSPTFTLVQTYETPEAEIWHFDLYRLEDPEEIFEIGWEEALSGGLSLVEWPDRLGPYAPQNAIDIEISITEDGHRMITIDDKRKTR